MYFIRVLMLVTERVYLNLILIYYVLAIFSISYDKS